MAQAMEHAREAPGGGIRPETAGGPDAEALARLREQRWLLRNVRDGVEESGRRLAGQEASARWQSPAQRAYAARLADLGTDLHGAWRALDDALWAADEAIATARSAR